MPLFYHLVEPNVWEKALNHDFYAPTGFDKEGFIHLSLENQIEGTLARHYPDARELVVLIIGEKGVKDLLRYEPGGPEGELFPHYYGKLPIEAVTDTRMLLKDKKGKWEWI